MTGAPLAFVPTPLHPAPRLGADLGLHDLWVKRDDCTGLAFGGNKARKLARLCDDAIARRCDVLVTGGGAQSNHARMTSAAASTLGLDCVLALGGHEPERRTANLLLDGLLGAEVRWVDAYDHGAITVAIEEIAVELSAAGRRPAAIPVGGANAIGAAAYVDAARELAAPGRPFDWVVVADGTGGTHAGLLAGLDPHTVVLGVDVGARPGLDEAVAELAAAAADWMGVPEPAAEVMIDHDHVGGGYAIATEEGVEAIRRAARLEGLLLDPAYTGKAMAALTTWVHAGRIAPDSRVCFWHTGGAPALFAGEYADVL